MSDTPDIDANADGHDEPLFEALASLPLRETPAGLVDSFRARIARGRQQRRRIHPALITGIAAMLVVAAGAGWWHERQQRMVEAQRAQVALAAALQNRSAGLRLEAINTVANEGRHGDAVENALITALLNDPNTNVRTAAAEALGRIARPAVLREAVGRALAVEKSMFVQMQLLDAAGRLPAAERRSAIAPLIDRADIDPLVTSSARQQMRDVSKGDSR